MKPWPNSGGFAGSMMTLPNKSPPPPPDPRAAHTDQSRAGAVVGPAPGPSGGGGPAHPVPNSHCVEDCRPRTQQYADVLLSPCPDDSATGGLQRPPTYLGVCRLVRLHDALTDPSPRTRGVAILLSPLPNIAGFIHRRRFRSAPRRS